METVQRDNTLTCILSEKKETDLPLLSWGDDRTWSQEKDHQTSRLNRAQV